MAALPVIEGGSHTHLLSPSDAKASDGAKTAPRAKRDPIDLKRLNRLIHDLSAHAERDKIDWVRIDDCLTEALALMVAKRLSGIPVVRREPQQFQGEPKKIRARRLLHDAVSKGLVPKPDSCERCGIGKRSQDIHGHHTDYGRPYDVEWLCVPCYQKEHPRFDMTTRKLFDKAKIKT